MPPDEELISPYAGNEDSAGVVTEDAPLFDDHFRELVPGPEGRLMEAPPPLPRPSPTSTPDPDLEVPPLKWPDKSLTSRDFPMGLGEISSEWLNQKLGKTRGQLNKGETNEYEDWYYNRSVVDKTIERYEKEDKENRAPTFKNYQKAITKDALESTSQPYIEETDPLFTQALKKSEPWRQKISSIAEQQPGERALNGAALGAGIGSKLIGPEGAIIGGAIGAYAGRGAGLAKSGEKSALDRDNRIWSSLMSMGAVGQDGTVEFEGSKIQMPADAQGRLKNLKINPISGARDRSLYQTDKTNPLTSRAMTVAKPLGMYFASGMLGYRENNKIDAEAKNSAAAMFANVFTDGVDSERAVYARARQMVKKMGVSEESMRAYFDTVKTKISIQEAEGIKKGLDLLFSK